MDDESLYIIFTGVNPEVPFTTFPIRVDKPLAVGDVVEHASEGAIFHFEVTRVNNDARTADVVLLTQGLT